MNNSMIFERITNTILENLEKGVCPWKKEWKGGFTPPRNGVTHRPYCGTNLWLTFLPYSSGDYFTFKQIKQLGGSVKKGEKGNLITFWGMFTPKDDLILDSDDQRKIPVLKYYTAFNREQCQNLPEDCTFQEEREISVIDEAVSIIENYHDKPEIFHRGNQPLYRPSADIIEIPEQKNFINDEAYYATLFHELIHSTGSLKRLNRFTKASTFGSDTYSREELVAELGAAFLCAKCGINNATIKNSSSYIGHWLEALNNDKKLFFDASRLAAKAVDYMIGA